MIKSRASACKCSREHLEKADAVIFVVDGSVPLKREDRALFNEIASKKKNCWSINKSDLPQDVRLMRN